MHREKSDRLLDASLFGYQPAEITWAKTQFWAPSDVQSKPPEWFTFGPDGLLRFRSKSNSYEGVSVPERKFLLARQYPSYDNPYGHPDLALCYWPAHFKHGGLEFWARFVEKFGIPHPVGKVPPGTPDSVADDLHKKLVEMIQDGAIVIPNDKSVEFLSGAGSSGSGSGGSGDHFEKFMLFCRSEIAIALLGQNQTTEVNANKASATAGLSVTDDIRDADAMMVATEINRLIGWICDFNWGDVERPVFSFWQQEEVDEVLAKRDSLLKQAGAVFTNQYLQRTYNLQDGDLAEPAAAPTPSPQPVQIAAHSVQPSVPTTPDIQTARLAQTANPLVANWTQHVAHRLADMGDLPALAAWLGQGAWDELPNGDVVQSLQQALIASELAGRYESGQSNGSG